MPWQRYVADVILEIDPLTGRLAYPEFGLTVPRQSGKSILLLAKAVHRASATTFFGSRQKIVYTAQTRHKAREKFEEDFVPDVITSRAFKGRARERMGNGNEHIRFPNGSRFGIEANTEKAGHGSTLDEAYIDEAFAQIDGRLEQAFGPAMITRKNKQLGWVSTAGWLDSSPYLQQKVAAGRAQVEMGIREGLAYFEWSVPDDVDPTDRSAWPSYMPALGHTINEADVAEQLAKAVREGTLHDFSRAYANRWVLKTATADWLVIPRQVWRSRLVAPVRPEVPAFAVAASWPDADRYVIGVAGRAGGLLVVQVLPAEAGAGWVIPRLQQLQDEHKPCAIVMRDRGPTAALHAEAVKAGLPLVTPWVKESATAFRVFNDVVGPGEPLPLGHFDQPELTAAVADGRRKAAGDGWVWDQPAPELEVVTLAAWGHSTRAHLATGPEPFAIWG